jgi:RNA polymerase sigma-70 factor (ECF subfamily)
MDTELVRRAQAGDGEAFAELVRRHARAMLQLADFVLLDRSAAEDAVQEAYMAAWKHRRALKDESAFSPWLRQIVLRECLRWRRHAFRRSLPLRDQVLGPPVHDADLHIDVMQAVRRLHPKLRAVIFLHFYEDATLATLANVLRIPESTAKTRLYDALRRLEQLLPGYRGHASIEEAP